MASFGLLRRIRLGSILQHLVLLVADRTAVAAVGTSFVRHQRVLDSVAAVNELDGRVARKSQLQGDVLWIKCYCLILIAYKLVTYN